MQPPRFRTTPRQRPAQRGVALFVVIVFVLLSMLLALWASRTSLFNELVVGNDADYQRAFEAAQALLQDAERDIRLSNDPSDPICATGGNVCRMTTADKFPLARQQEKVGSQLQTLASQTGGCRNALCTKRSGAQDFWNNKDSSKGPTLYQMTTAGARYGDYTGAAIGSVTAPISPILTARGDCKEPEADNCVGGWYWIEVLPYDESSKNSGVIVGGNTNLLGLNIDPSVVYRITALAYGRKSSSMVVLQQTYAPQRLKD